MLLHRANSCPFCGSLDHMVTHRFYCPEVGEPAYVPPFALLISLFIGLGAGIGAAIVWLVH